MSSCYRGRLRAKTRFLFASLVLLAYIFFLSADRASAQAAAYISDETVVIPDKALPTIRTSVNEVNLIFSAVDHRGRFVDDLSESQIELRDKGVPPAAIHRFAVQTDQPLRIVLLIDSSDSVTGRFEFEKKAAADFLQVAMRPGIDQALIVGFSHRVHIYQEWTGDLNALRASVESIPTGGSTGFYDALVYVAKRLAEQDRTVRRMIIAITDGEDNDSHASLATAIERVLRAEAPVYVVNTNVVPIAAYGDPDVVPAIRSMQKIASDTGGQFIPGDSRRELRSAFKRIDTELRNQYLIAYTPANFIADGRFRKIDLAARKRRGVLIHARRGYYSDRAIQARTSSPCCEEQVR